MGKGHETVWDEFKNSAAAESEQFGSLMQMR
jgi:hypothetical protein